MGRKVQMIVGMSGTRADGRPWPGTGEFLVVDDWEAEHLIRGEMARPASQEEVQPTPPPAVPEPVQAQELVPEQPAVDPGAKPPKPVQPKADWVAYAMSQGLDEDSANMMTKAALMETYGGRT